MFNRKLAALAVLFVVGCSKEAPQNTGDLPKAPVVPTVSPQISADQPPLPKSKAEITAAMAERGFKPEPFEPEGLRPETSGYFVKGEPFAVVFHERDGKLMMVEGITQPNKSDKKNEKAIAFGKSLGEDATGIPRHVIYPPLANAVIAIGTSPGNQSGTFDRGKGRFKVDVIRQQNGGYSFIFSAVSETKP